MTRPVEIARSSVAENVGEVVFEDPFRRLEDDSPQVLAWQTRANAEADAAFSAIPGLAVLRAELARHLAADSVVPPTPAGGHWFWLDRDVGGRGRRLRVGERVEREGRTLVTAADVPLDGNESIDWHAPSPDGRLVAFGVSSNGDEQSILCLVDAESSTIVEPRVRHVGDGPVAWLPDSTGLYCCAGRGPAHETSVKRLVLVRPRGAATAVAAPLGAERYRPVIQVSSDGRYLGVSGWGHFPRLVFVLDRVADVWHEALPDEQDGQVFFGVFVGHEYYAVTTYGAARGRLVAVPADSVGDEATWREIVPQGRHVLRSVRRCGDDLLLYELVAGQPRLRFISPAGEPRGHVPLPDDLVISATARDRPHIPVEMPIGVAGSTLVFAASSVNRSPTLWRYNRDRNRLSEMTRPAVALPSLVCESMTCQAQDGYEVRYDLVRRANHAPDRPAPTLIYGYGGFNAAWMSKGYPSVFTPWILAGGTYVFAHLRGDGTYGRDQWHGGRLEAKQRTFDDVFAVAEDLIARGATASDRLAIAGGSNGGLLVAAAITQRPELFRAAAVLVPVTDLARFGTDRFGEACLVEYGDARDADAARWLRAYSPYHNVVAGARYPDTVIVCGDRDMRTPAWHGRKLAAALRAAGGGNSQVLLRVHEDCGHLTAGLGGSPGRIAEWLGFVMQAVGLRPEEGASHMVPRASSDRA